MKLANIFGNRPVKKFLFRLLVFVCVRVLQTARASQ